MTHDGIFLVSSCYHALANTNIYQNPQTSTSNLSWIWRTKVPNKINHFLWLCWHSKIKSNSLLNHRGMEVDPNCITRPQLETRDHILRDCYQAKEVWEILAPYLDTHKSTAI